MCVTCHSTVLGEIPSACAVEGVVCSRATRGCSSTSRSVNAIVAARRIQFPRCPTDEVTVTEGWVSDSPLMRWRALGLGAPLDEGIVVTLVAPRGVDQERVARAAVMIEELKPAHVGHVVRTVATEG